MSKKNEKIFVVAIASLVVLALLFLPLQNTYFGMFLDIFSEPNWEEVHPKNIVKNAIPINLIGQENGNCKTSALKFDYIVDHEYFIRADELARKLNYDRDDKTIILPCDMLKGDKSKLNVWYMLEETPKHSKKYQYFVTIWNETSSD